MTEVDLPDANVLLALVHPDHVHHDAALSWFRKVERFATTPVTEIRLLRLSLNPSVTSGRVDTESALASLRSLRRDPRWSFLSDDGTLTETVIQVDVLVGFRQVTDLHLIDLAARHGHRFVTFDARIVRTVAPQDRTHVVTLN